VFLSFCFSSISLYALEAPTNLRVSDSSSGEVTIDWESVPGAIGYYYYIWNESGQYTDGIDLIDSTEYTISNIDDQKLYYIAVTSVDEFGSESAYSNEVSYSALTGTPINGNGFRVRDVEILDEMSMYVNFSRELDSSDASPKDFIIEEKNTGIELLYTLAQVDSNDSSKILVILDSELKSETEYEITILDVRDSEWNTIESWIDAFLSFTTWNFSPEAVVEDETFNLESASWGDIDNTQNTGTSIDPVDNFSENTSQSSTNQGNVNSSNVTQNSTNQGNINSSSTNQDNTVNTNSSSQVTKASSWNSAWNAGVTISDDTYDDGVNQVATETEKLPQTGPEHIILILVAILLSAGMFYKTRK